MMPTEYYPLLQPELHDTCRVLLADARIPAADARRFARQFISAWDRLPTSARNAMLATGAPFVELKSQIFDHRGERIYGQCSSPPSRLHFAWDWCRGWPDRRVEALVGHELAHATCWALGCEREWVADEPLIDSLAACWGFDIAELNQAIGLRHELVTAAC